MTIGGAGGTRLLTVAPQSEQQGYGQYSTCRTKLSSYLRRRQRLQESWGLSRRLLTLGRGREAFGASDS